MATVVDIVAASGLRRIDTFLQDASGYPDGDQSGAAGYDGTRLTGVKGFVPTIPDVVRVQHTGDDITFDADYFAPSELPSATITSGKTNLNIDAILAGSLVQTIGETRMGVMATDIDGQEPDITLIYHRQALDEDENSPTKGKRRWFTGVVPIANIVPKGGSADYQSDDTNNYFVNMKKATRTPWGSELTMVDNGVLQAVFLRFNSEYPLRMVRWTGDGTIDEFNLIANQPPISIAKTKVWTNGTAATVSAIDTTLTAPTVTLDSAPASGAIVVAWYETSGKI